MRVVMFYHSVVSDWNNGNAHFLRGIASELIAQGHTVRIYEPRNAWSVDNLVSEAGTRALAGYREAYPKLVSHRYKQETIDLDRAIDGADLVIVHEWNEQSLVQRIGEHRAASRSYRLLFHDTHHRSVTDPDSMAAYDLSNYDGVLAFGATVRDVYLHHGWAERAWTWHEAADTSVFRPHPEIEPTRDLVWIGNWGDDERAAELEEFLIQPVQDLEIKASIFGVRYPDGARQILAHAGIDYLGWVPNYLAPLEYAASRVTVHVPRRPYVRALPGIPTIRVFEALACRIPLVSAPWSDSEHLFKPGTDFLVAHTGEEMRRHLRDILEDPDLAETVGASGRNTVLAKHTCRHRVDELLAIVRSLNESQSLAGAA